MENFLVGQSYNVSCQVVGSHPLPQVKMFVGSRELEIIKSEVSQSTNVLCDNKVF
jgi:hypothetical protein